LTKEFDFKDKDQALKFFQALRQLFRGWNSAEWGSEEFKNIEKEIISAIESGIKEKEEVKN
jgi:hypothetical protein